MQRGEGDINVSRNGVQFHMVKSAMKQIKQGIHTLYVNTECTKHTLTYLYTQIYLPNTTFGLTMQCISTDN